MGPFDELLEYNENLVEEEMDYEFFKEHYLEDNSSLFDDEFDSDSFDDGFGFDDGDF